MLIQEPVYVTPDDFFTVYNKNLREMLCSTDNESNEAENFLALVTNHLKNWIDANTFRLLDYDCLTPYQYNHWQRAILAQAYYTYKEGAKALGLASGIDDEKGVIITRDLIVESEICDAAQNHLANAGLLNFNIKNRPRALRGLISTEFYGGGGGVKPCPTPTPTPTPTPGHIITGIAYTEDE